MLEVVAVEFETSANLRRTEWASLIVAVLALAIAGLGYRHSVRSAAREQVLRQDEIALVRRQFEEESGERERRQRAHAVGVRTSAAGSTRGVEYTFMVTSGGPAIAREIRARLDRTDGAPLTGWETVSASLITGSGVSVKLEAPRREIYDGPLTLVLAWQDDAGPQKSATDVPLH